MVGRKERVGCMARVTWKFTLPYVKQIPNGNLLYDSGNSKLVLCNNLEGWDGEECGKEVQEGEDICISKADSC